MISLPNAVVRSSAVRFIVNNNPFYVLSAMCMLAGLFMLNDSLHYSPIPATKLLTLIATLNVYEWFIIGLSVCLLRRGILRDGGLILLIEVFFLADVAFLNAELFTASPTLAWPSSLILLGLACAKLIVILRALETHRPVGRTIEPGIVRLVLSCSLATLLLLFAIPGFLFEYANHHGGQVPAPILYGIWWIVGLLPALAVYLPGSQRLFGLGVRLPRRRLRLHRRPIRLPANAARRTHCRVPCSCFAWLFAAGHRHQRYPIRDAYEQSAQQDTSNNRHAMGHTRNDRFVFPFGYWCRHQFEQGSLPTDPSSGSTSLTAGGKYIRRIGRLFLRIIPPTKPRMYMRGFFIATTSKPDSKRSSSPSRAKPLSTAPQSPPHASP
jgi:hypothetical protein